MAANDKSADTYRVANFSAGPSNLPLDVLKDVEKNLINYDGNGMSVMEMSHRSKMFQKIWDDAISDIKNLLSIPDNYEIMFLQGGATLQFSAIPFNFNLNNKLDSEAADYLITGNWSKKAYDEAIRLCGDKKVNCVFTTMNEKPQATRVPSFINECKFNDNASYLHICINETVHGVEMDLNKHIPFDKIKVPIVADFSSCFMSKPIDVSKFAVIYGGAQKNIGPAGVTVVIIRNDLIGKGDPKTPLYLDWKTHKGKMYNTPPCFSVYVMGLVFKWLKNLGGLKEMSKINNEKANLLYKTIDDSNGFYFCPVTKDCRSEMNIRFNCKDGESIEKEFIERAAKLDMYNLKGYRTLGGIRASCYNAMSIENVKKLVKFMINFQKEKENANSKLK